MMIEVEIVTETGTGIEIGIETAIVTEIETEIETARRIGTVREMTPVKLLL